VKWPITLPSQSIDAYAYYGSWPYWPLPEDDETSLVARLDRFSMRAAVVISLRSVFGDMRRGQ